MTLDSVAKCICQCPGEEVKYKVELQPAEGAVQVSDGSVNVLVSLTSAVMREPAGTTPHRTDTNTDTDTDSTATIARYARGS